MARTLFGWLRPAIVPLVGALGLAAVASHQLSEQRQQMLTDRESGLRSLVEAAVSVVGDWHHRFQSGEVPEAEARHHALQSLESIRYNHGSYMFVVDEDVSLLMHPMRDLVGQSMADLRDANGVLLFVELVAAADHGGGWVPFHWNRAGGDLAPKIAYAAPFELWGWVVGTAIYVDDIDWVIQTQAREIGLMGGLVTIIALLVSYLMPSRKGPKTTHRGAGPARQTIADARGAAGGTPHLPTEVGNLATASEELSRQSEKLAAQVAVLKDHIRTA